MVGTTVSPDVALPVRVTRCGRAGLNWPHPTVTRDIDLDGQHLRQNDRVVISWLSANRDEKEFDRPNEIILDRAPNRHVAFGLGRAVVVPGRRYRVMATGGRLMPVRLSALVSGRTLRPCKR